MRNIVYARALREFGFILNVYPRHPRCMLDIFLYTSIGQNGPRRVYTPVWRAFSAR
jgi:hypothetical protein